jgi:hypothetical protein
LKKAYREPLSFSHHVRTDFTCMRRRFVAASLDSGPEQAPRFPADFRAQKAILICNSMRLLEAS